MKTYFICIVATLINLKKTLTLRLKTRYFIRLICKLTEIERKLTQKFENKENGLKYNSVKEEFKKIGLVIPQGFEKPGQESDGRLIKRSWYFDDWKKSIKDEYSIIRTNIIVMCSGILNLLEEKGGVERKIENEK